MRLRGTIRVKDNKLEAVRNILTEKVVGMKVAEFRKFRKDIYTTICVINIPDRLWNTIGGLSENSDVITEVIKDY